MKETERGQVTHSAAEVYDAFFVPSLFQEWAARVADAARLQPGQRVLDVACGTGVLACEAFERVGPAGSVVGLDVNEGMLAVARRKAPSIEWRQGLAEALPFESAHFDRVVCQFGLMFFEDRRAAVSEMARVLRPAGRLTVAVWGALEHCPGYAMLATLLQRLFGDAAADALRAPFALGDPQALSPLFEGATLKDVSVTRLAGTARFPSIQAWLFTEIKGWVLADLLDEARFALLLREAEAPLQPFFTAAGTVAFSIPAYLVTASRA